MPPTATSPRAPLRVIARIHTDFTDKFGLPRQSGLIDALEGLIVFEKPFRQPEALRGIDGYSHLWLLWQFSRADRTGWSATVRPPRLGGNQRVGVFATRSPNRPNAIGLSAVRLVAVEPTPDAGLALRVAGVDMTDGTPIFDIKPYLPYADAYPHARGGFAEAPVAPCLTVDFPPELLWRVPAAKRDALIQALALDPRPAYQHDAARAYGLAYAGLDIRFTVQGARLTVMEVTAGKRGDEEGVAFFRGEGK